MGGAGCPSSDDRLSRPLGSGSGRADGPAETEGRRGRRCGPSGRDVVSWSGSCGGVGEPEGRVLAGVLLAVGVGHRRSSIEGTAIDCASRGYPTRIAIDSGCHDRSPDRGTAEDARLGPAVTPPRGFLSEGLGRMRLLPQMAHGQSGGAPGARRVAPRPGFVSFPVSVSDASARPPGAWRPCLCILRFVRYLYWSGRGPVICRAHIVLFGEGQRGREPLCYSAVDAADRDI